MVWLKKYILGKEKNMKISLQDIREANLQKHETYKKKGDAHSFLMISRKGDYGILYPDDCEENERRILEWYNERKQKELYTTFENRKSGYYYIYNSNTKKERKVKITSVDFEAIIRVIKRIQEENTQYVKNNGFLSGIYFAAIFQLLNDGNLGKSKQLTYHDFETMMKSNGFHNASHSIIQEKVNKIQRTDDYPYLELVQGNDNKKSLFASFVNLFIDYYKLEKTPKTGQETG